MPLAARQSPNEERIDGAKQNLAPLGAGSQPWRVFQQMGDLRAGKIRVEEESRALAKQRFVAASLQALADRRADPALPDDRVGNRLASRLFPQHRRLALVRNADRGDVLGCK